MSKEPGIYRVVYNLPGSLGYCNQQFIYTQEMDTSINDIARQRAIIKDSKRYDVNKSKINIINIEFIRPISEHQKTLTNQTIFDN